MFYIYVLQNQIDLKVYVGKTKDPELRYKQHTSYELGRSGPLHNAIKKYGSTSFTYTIIEEYEDEQECLNAEMFWIEFFRSNRNRYGNEYGYNLTDGGEGLSGYKWTEEERARRSGMKRTEEVKAAQSKRITGDSNPMFGKTHTDETKAKIAATRIGKCTLTEDGRKRLSESSKGKTPAAKINEQDVIAIRDYYRDTPGKSKDKFAFLSDKYGMSRKGLEMVIYRYNWKHIP